MSDEKSTNEKDSNDIAARLKTGTAYDIVLLLCRLQDTYRESDKEWMGRAHEIFKLYHTAVTKMAMTSVANGTYFPVDADTLRTYAQFRAAKNWTDIIIVYNQIDFQKCASALNMVALQEYMDDVISGLIILYFKE